MRRDAIRQLRTVAGHQTAAAPQEEAAGISGGQEAKARRPTDVPREGMVLLDAVVRHDRRRFGIGAPVPRPTLRGPGCVHAARRFRAGTSDLHHGASRTADRPVQLHMELVPRGVHQRRVQLQSHLRDVQDGRWRRRRRWRWRRWTCQWRWPRWRQIRARSCVVGQHQGLRLPSGRRLCQLHKGVRRNGCHVPVPLFPAESHASCYRLRQTATVHRYRPLFCRTVHYLRDHVHRAVCHALRLSVIRCSRTAETVQEFRRTFTHRRIQVLLHLYLPG